MEGLERRVRLIALAVLALFPRQSGGEDTHRLAVDAMRNLSIPMASGGTCPAHRVSSGIEQQRQLRGLPCLQRRASVRIRSTSSVCSSSKCRGSVQSA